MSNDGCVCGRGIRCLVIGVYVVEVMFVRFKCIVRVIVVPPLMCTYIYIYIYSRR